MSGQYTSFQGDGPPENGTMERANKKASTPVAPLDVQAAQACTFLVAHPVCKTTTCFYCIALCVFTRFELLHCALYLPNCRQLRAVHPTPRALLCKLRVCKCRATASTLW